MRFPIAVIALFAAGSLLAQSRPPSRQAMRVMPRAAQAEAALKQAMDMLGEERKAFERDLEVLKHIQAADAALTDPMQPSNAIQKAYDEIDKAKQLRPEFFVMQGVIKIANDLTEARRSPPSADFGRLRAVLQEHAEGPASRLVVSNALRLEEETLMWIKIQELIALHLKTLSELAGDSLRGSVK